MSHLHLAPTLLDMLGAPAPAAFQGRSLWTNLRRGVAWDDPAVVPTIGPAIIECAYGCTNPFRAERRSAARLLAVRDARFKLAMRIESGAVEEVYDLEADPAELNPALDGLEFETRKRLLRAAWAHLEQTIADRDGVLRLRARLRDLRLEWKSNNS